MKIELKANLEPTLFKSVSRIAEYYVRASKYIHRLCNDNNQELIYRRFVTKLPENFKENPNDFFILKIGSYNLEDHSLKQIYKNIEVECHIDDNGRIISVYTTQK